jgi:hypothetical protein
MTRNDIIKANSRSVVNDSTNSLAETWNFRRLTSKYGEDPRTYDADWTEFQGLGTRDANTEQYDDRRQVWYRSNTNFVRAPDNLPSPKLKNGDQVKDPNGSVFAVVGVSSSGPGTIQYALTREEFLYADAERGGGA